MVGRDSLHPGQDAWPPDLNRDCPTNSGDIVLFRDHMGTMEGNPFYSRRFDFNADQVANALDLVKMRPFMGGMCGP